ncbi:ABC transporter permease subunit [Streptomyces sp. MB09-02B]|uniref:ABC transporter permease subunit n=1 Tax=Streptomyces sp. MB09-02B TaxID=3028667 RepID=UPI00299FBAB3|nr:ABC transporter permease subunit [Streptomyces sp. MB09-02B]MDX3643976.1 ABC transporter permease subunit [Streptomyces sp. MB09-02B]
MNRLDNPTATPAQAGAALAARSADLAPAPAVSPARGLVRAVLRVHQSALWFWGLLVGLVAAGLLWAAGPGYDAVWTAYVKSGCAEAEYCTIGDAYTRYDLAVSLGSTALVIAPVLIGAWAGASLIARELESGTARLAWTQSVSPARWLAAKLAVPAAVIVSGTVLLTLLNRLVWWREERLRHALGTRDWFAFSTFLGNGTLATALALFALALGVVAGLLLRRSLPALAVALVGMAVVMGTLRTMRHHLWPVETLVSQSADRGWTGELVDRGLVTTSGERISDAACEEITCGRTDVATHYADFHPSSHFWPLHLVQTALLLTLTATLVWAAFRVLRHRAGRAV